MIDPEVFFFLYQQNCSLVTLSHEDIYSSMERPAYLLQMVCLEDVVIKAEPLASGLANDIHGQVISLNAPFLEI